MVPAVYESRCSLISCGGSATKPRKVQHGNLRRKPLLILVNKADREDAPQVAEVTAGTIANESRNEKIT